MPIHPVGRDYSQTLREDRELAILADQLGFVDGFFGEHFTDAALNFTPSTAVISMVVVSHSNHLITWDPERVSTWEA